MAKMTEEQLEEMGRELAAKCSYSGDWVLRVCMAALTDANYHEEAEVIEKMLAAIDATEETLEYELTIKEQS